MKINKEGLVIESDSVSVRPLKVTDITNEYIDGLNDPEVNKYLVVCQNRQTRGSVTRYVQADWDNPLSILFGIFIKDNKHPFVGTIRVHNIDLYHFSAIVGVCLFAKRAWKKGYACNALHLVKKYLFEDIQLHYLEARIWAENMNSIHCFLHAGFVEQYRITNRFRLVDRYEDAIMFAAINPRFDMSLLRNRFPEANV